MSLTYSFQSPRDVFNKLKRDAAKLEECTGDNLFNFMVTATSLRDWIGNGPAKTSPEIKKGLEELRRHTSIKICRDIANASKHFTLLLIMSQLLKPLISPLPQG